MKIKNPRVAATIERHRYISSISPTIYANMVKTAKAEIETPEAGPLRPSMILTALVTPTIAKIVKMTARKSVRKGKTKADSAQIRIADYYENSGAYALDDKPLFLGEVASEVF